MGCVVGAVGNGAHGGEGYVVVGADLGHGSAFHFNGQSFVTGTAQSRLQGAGRFSAGDETVAAGNQSTVYFGAGWQPSRGCAVWPECLFGGRTQQGREGGLAGKACAPVKRYFVTRKQWRGVKVVLNEVQCHHHIANPHAGFQTAGHSCEDNAADAQVPDQHRGRQAGRDLTDARQGQHNRLTLQTAEPEVTRGHRVSPGAFKLRQQAGLFFGQRAQNGRAAGRAHFLSRNSRRRILPTGVLGSSVRNSITLGRL